MYARVFFYYYPQSVCLCVFFLVLVVRFVLKEILKMKKKRKKIWKMRNADTDTYSWSVFIPHLSLLYFVHFYCNDHLSWNNLLVCWNDRWFVGILTFSIRYGSIFIFYLGPAFFLRCLQAFIRLDFGKKKVCFFFFPLCFITFTAISTFKRNAWRTIREAKKIVCNDSYVDYIHTTYYNYNYTHWTVNLE